MKSGRKSSAASLAHTVVVNGDVLDNDILEELNLPHTDMLITVTDNDEVNVLAALLAKRLGCARTVALVNTVHYQPLVTSLGVDVAVSPRAITVSTILQHLRRGRIRAVHSLREGVGEIIEAEAMDTSRIVGKPLNSVKLDKGIMVGAIVRGEAVIMPRGDSVIQAKDRVILYALPNVRAESGKAVLGQPGILLAPPPGRLSPPDFRENRNVPNRLCQRPLYATPGCGGA